MVIVKDMSRFGRNYLEVGLYTEVRFPELGVRFIAINDGVDSDNQMENDFTPFRNIMNEWYAKDTSKKLRAVFRNKGMSGKRLSTHAPYGYLRGQDGHLLIDEETAPTVKLIFQLCAEGNGTGVIARILRERSIPTPGTIEFQRTGRTKRYHPDDPCGWRPETIVNMRLAYALFERLKPGAQLVLVGDPDQLPSVGPGNVLREMIRSQMIPTAVLDIVFRQASNSRIALNAQAVNHNDTRLQYGPDFAFYDVADSEAANQLILKCYFEEVSKHGVENVQILSPQRRKGVVCSNRLNEQIREIANPPRIGVREIKCGGRLFREGDRIIQTKSEGDVSNGDVGVITAIREDGEGEPTIHIRLLDGREFEYSADMLEKVDLSYCISIHKSQGAEFPVVIIPILKEHYIMLRRNLLYTAISRAKVKVILIGQKQAVFMAIHKSDVDKRNTILSDRIVAYYAREKQNLVG